MLFTIYGRRITFVFLLFCCTSAWAQRTVPATYGSPTAINYVRTWFSIIPDTASASFHIETPVNKAQMVSQYLDGLGRPVQTVIKKGSLATDLNDPFSTINSKDLVNAVEYDSFGREQFTYLPFVANNAGANTSLRDGMFKQNPFEQQAAFYDDANSVNPLKGQGETYFYGQTLFEPSPTNRSSFTYAPGNNWVGAGRGTETQYLLNTISDSVRIWTVSSIVSAEPTTDSCYKAGELYKTVSIDEHGNKLVEYKDKEGLLLLKKIQLASTPGTAHVGWVCTYYVYDGLNHLRFVLQPKAVETLLYSGSWTISNNVRDELCFYYGYDYRNRTIIKKAPGAGEMYMVYDAQDRLSMMQDSNMRASSKWLVTLYDVLNRPIQTGLVNNSSIGSKSFATHLSDAKVAAAYPFNISSIPGSGYDELIRRGYDDYDSLPSGAPSGALATTYITSTNFITTYEASPDYAEQVSQSAQTRGLAVWIKAKILGTSSSYLYTTRIFDERARVIQTKETNLSGGVDTLTVQYDFSGKMLRNHMAHSKAGTNAHRYYVLTKNSYDGLQRLISISKRANRDGSTNTADKTILKNYYDELGQLKTKRLGNDPTGVSNALESLVYDYNIRGWLLGMNRDFAKTPSSTDNHFGFDLAYDKTDIAATGGSSIGSYTAQYNGSIGGMLWKSSGDDQIRKYDFSYDALNRLTNADFTQYSGAAFDKTAGIDFSVHNLSFDANGNVLTMDQKGWKVGGSATIDSLYYNYYSNSNKLLNVIDKSNDVNTRLGDFRSSSVYMSSLGGSKTAAATDYIYDGNGSLVRDLNKDIITYGGADGIEYNYLDLPKKITVKGSAGDKGAIEYTYDALGNKLKKLTTEGSLVTTTLYMYGNYINDTLQYLPQEEGRIRYNMDSSRFEYDYFIKDHLDNTRMVLTEEQKADAYPAATMEVADSATQNLFYANLTETRVSLPSGYPTDTYTSPNNKVAKLNGGTGGHKTGPSIVLKVMAGDHFNLRVSDWYKLNGSTPSTPNPINDLATILANSIGGVVGSKATPTELGSSGVLSPGVTSFFSSQSYNSSRPKAYINWILFDEQFQYVSGSSGSEQVGADNTLNVHQFSSLPLSKNGYLYIYVSNETPNVDVFFDNLQVTHLRGPIVEETHYYPFGLTMSGISSHAASFGGPQNRKNFNGGTELERSDFSDGSGLELYATDFRSYDPQLGRFHQIDALNDEAEDWSPYSFAYNNPVSFNDPLGLKADTSKPNVILPTGFAPDPVVDPKAPRGSVDNPIPTNIDVIVVAKVRDDYWLYKSRPILQWKPVTVYSTGKPSKNQSGGSSGGGAGFVAAGATIVVDNPVGAAVGASLLAAYGTYTLINSPVYPGMVEALAGAPDNTRIFRPAHIFESKGQSEDRLKGGGQKQRDSNMQKYPIEFQRWYHREYKPDVHPGRNATDEELEKAYDDWRAQGMPKVK